MKQKTAIFGMLFATMSMIAVVIWFIAFGNVAHSEKVNTEWEYLVVTPLGKVRFGIAEKAQGVKSESLGDFVELSEGVSTEKWMDELGNRGWELVDVVGMIGGDQEFIFKRKT